MATTAEAPQQKQKKPILGKTERKSIKDALWDQNPISIQILGICSALAVTVQLTTTIVMCVAVIAVVALSNVVVSALRHRIPSEIRIIVEIVVISALVIMADQILKAFLFDISKQLSIFVGCFLLGAKTILPIILTSYAVGGFWEVIFAVVRKHEINEGFLVTGLLLPLTLPPTIPLWQVGLAASFGVVIGKEVFGGTGMNILNPALTARAFIFFAYPGNISGDRVWRAIDYGKDTLVQGYTGATPLLIVSNAEAGTPIQQIVQDSFFHLERFIPRVGAGKYR